MENTIVFPLHGQFLLLAGTTLLLVGLLKINLLFGQGWAQREQKTRTFPSLQRTKDRTEQNKTPKQQKKQSHENRGKQTSIDKFQVIFTFLNGTSLVHQYI